MSVKEFTVLAACIDIRSGRRFAIGEVFDPAPTEDQARRLVKAGCLPVAAIDAASAEAEAKAEAEAEAKAKAEAEAKAKAEAEAKAKASRAAASGASA